MFGELFDYVCGSGARTGCGFALYLGPEGADRDIDVEAVAELFDPLPGNARVRVYEMPAVEQMAGTVHHGPFATLNQAYRAIMERVEANGYPTMRKGAG